MKHVDKWPPSSFPQDHLRSFYLIQRDDCITGHKRSTFLKFTMSGEKKSEGLLLNRNSVEKIEVEHVKSDDSEETYDFGGESTLPRPPKLTPEQERKLYRKIDLRIIPIVTLMFLTAFLDRGTCIIVTSGPTEIDPALSTGNIGRLGMSI